MKKYLAIFLVITAFFATAQTPGEDFDVTHYDIYLNEIDFTSQTLQAQTTVTLTALNTITSIVLELKTLTVIDVFSTDVNVSGYTQNDAFLTINLASPLVANASASFTITYGGNTFNDGWGGVLWSGNYICNMGVGFESVPHNLGKTWFPCVDNFTDKATYDVHVTVPDEMTAVCGGNLESIFNNGDGTKTVHYNVPQEIATYHISFVAGNYVEYTDTYNGMERDIPINVYVKPSQINSVPGTFVHVKDIASYFESCYGPYPFNRIGYAVTSVGCMEHVDNIGITSGIVTGNTSQESYIAHEMSHMWFGNRITCARAEEMWLNEGFAQFCGLNYRESVYGEADYKAEMDALIETVIKSYDKAEGWLTLNNVPMNYTYGNTVYSKGATVVHTMRNYLGHELFNEAMRYYLNKFASQSVTSEDLRDAITEYTGIDMTSFFDTWVFTCGEPHYTVDKVVITPNCNSFNVNVYTGQRHRHSDHIGNDVILELAFMDEDWNITTDTIHWSGAMGATSKTLDFAPIAVFCDYNNLCADARIDRQGVMKSTGRLAGINMEAKVLSITDSTFLRIENHFIGPSHPMNNDWEMHYPEESYWSVFRDDKGDANINGIFTYKKTDLPSILQTSNDSIVLLYREDASTPWRSIPYTQAGTWQGGKITVDEINTGDYTFASIDKTHLGLSENSDDSQKIILIPNPAVDMVKIRTNIDDSEVLIVNCLGQIMAKYPVLRNEVTISVEGFPAGIYYVSLLDGKKNIISTEKLVKR